MIPEHLNHAECLFLSAEDVSLTGAIALVVVEPKALVRIAEDFFLAGYCLEDITGLHVSEGAVSLYHFDHFETPGRVTVLALSPSDAPVFPSISSVYQGAEWHERETRDFFGFIYDGNPNFIPLLLAEDMADVHPLLKTKDSLAPLSTFFPVPGKNREVIRKDPSFTLLDRAASESPPAKKNKPKKESSDD